MKIMLNLLIEIIYCEFYNNNHFYRYRIKANTFTFASDTNRMDLKDLT